MIRAHAVVVVVNVINADVIGAYVVQTNAVVVSRNVVDGSRV